MEAQFIVYNLPLINPLEFSWALLFFLANFNWKTLSSVRTSKSDELHAITSALGKHTDELGWRKRGSYVYHRYVCVCTYTCTGIFLSYIYM